MRHSGSTREAFRASSMPSENGVQTGTDPMAHQDATSAASCSTKLLYWRFESLQNPLLQCIHLVRQDHNEHLALSRKAILPVAWGWAPPQTRACNMGCEHQRRAFRRCPHGFMGHWHQGS